MEVSKNIKPKLRGNSLQAVSPLRERAGFIVRHMTRPQKGKSWVGLGNFPTILPLNPLETDLMSHSVGMWTRWKMSNQLTRSCCSYFLFSKHEMGEIKITLKIVFWSWFEETQNKAKIGHVKTTVFLKKNVISMTDYLWKHQTFNAEGGRDVERKMLKKHWITVLYLQVSVRGEENRIPGINILYR